MSLHAGCERRHNLHPRRADGVDQLQEAKVPDALYDSLEHAIPASNDVLQAVPDASGAFCLNQIGLAHLLTRDLILKYFAAERVDSHASMTRVRFEELCEDLLRVIMEPVEKVIKDSKVDKGSGHEIVPVGGSTVTRMSRSSSPTSSAANGQTRGWTRQGCCLRRRRLGCNSDK